MGFGKDGKGVMIREDSNVALGTLNAKTGILLGSPNLSEDMRILKSIINAHIDGLTTNEGPLSLYMVNGELSLAECQEAIEQNGPLDRNDRVAQERAERFVKPVAWFESTPDTGVNAILGKSVAQPFAFNPRWTFSDPEGWDYMVYNESAGNLASGSTCFLKATHFGVWVQ